jgi:hypothetical protein
MWDFHPDAIEDYLEILSPQTPVNATLTITHETGVCTIPVVWWGQYIDDDRYIGYQMFNNNIDNLKLKVTLDKHPEIFCDEFLYDDAEELVTKIPLQVLLAEHNIVGEGDPFDFGTDTPDVKKYYGDTEALRGHVLEIAARTYLDYSQDLKSREPLYTCTLSELVNFTKDVIMHDWSYFTEEDEDKESLDDLFSIWGVDRNDTNFDIDDCPGDR